MKDYFYKSILDESREDSYYKSFNDEGILKILVKLKYLDENYVADFYDENNIDGEDPRLLEAVSAFEMDLLLKQVEDAADKAISQRTHKQKL